MKYLRWACVGIAIGVMAAAAGIETWSAAWWAWIVSGNFVVAFSGD